MPTSKNLNNFVINKVESQAVFNEMKRQGMIESDETYWVLGGQELPEVTTSDNGKVATVTNGSWSAENLPIAKNNVFYGTCDTEQTTKAKVATLVDGSDFSLSTGVMVCIKFTNASAEATMTLNVNGTGAKSIMRYGTTTASSGTSSGWRAGSVVIFAYDGTNWVRIYWENTTYGVATASANGLMSSADKTKLDSLSVYSPVKTISANYTLLPEDIGKTLMVYNVPSGTTSITISVPNTTQAQGMPAGSEFAVYLHARDVTVNIERATSDVYIGCSEWGSYYNGTTKNLKMSGRLSMVAIKRVFQTDPYWLVTGEYETL